MQSNEQENLIEENSSNTIVNIVQEKENKEEKKGETPRIIEKFTNEDGQVDVEKMASKMSSLTEQNFTFKRIILFSSLFLVILVGLMVSANVIGSLMLKDTKVKDNQLVTRDEKPVVIDTREYDVLVNLFTTDKVLDGLKYLYVPVKMNGEDSILHMQVDSYVKTPEAKIIFIGEKYCLILQRYFYELVLNDPTFDPLTYESFPVLNTISDPTSKRSKDERSVYNSADKLHFNVHETVNTQTKRDNNDKDEKEMATLKGKGSVAAPPKTRIGETPNLNYHAGGPVVTSGIVVPIVWNYGFFDTYSTGCFRRMPTFFNDLLTTKAFTTYTPGIYSSDPQSKIAGVDSSVHYLTPSTTKTVLSDYDVIVQLYNWLVPAYNPSSPNTTIPKDTTNPLKYLYMIFFPSGISLSSGSCSKFCGYHSYFTATSGTVSQRYVFAALPWPGNCPNNCSASIYSNNFFPGDAYGNRLCGSAQSVAYHELTEIATDPLLNAYYDASGLENADKCATWRDYGCFTRSTNTYCVQPAWNHAQCTFSTSSGVVKRDCGCTNSF